MKVAVTGGTGFIGNYVVGLLLKQQLQVIVVGKNKQRAAAMPWFGQVDFIEADINAGIPEESLKEIASADKIVHLAWSGLPNYKELYHYEQQLLPQYNFVKALVNLGAKDITVTGTCFEYGIKEGPLDVSMPSDPQNPYALAKDTLRKFLQQLQQKHSFRLKWLRLFYMYGKGQSPNSILSQLDKALDNGETVFNMSGGEQLRDYLPVEEVAKQIVEAILDDKKDGLFNVCSGTPITVKKLVEDHLAKNNRSIKLNPGYYPYPDYEAMAFWGVKQD